MPAPMMQTSASSPVSSGWKPGSGVSSQQEVVSPELYMIASWSLASAPRRQGEPQGERDVDEGEMALLHGVLEAGGEPVGHTLEIDQIGEAGHGGGRHDGVG